VVDNRERRQEGEDRRQRRRRRRRRSGRWRVKIAERLWGGSL